MIEVKALTKKYGDRLAVDNIFVYRKSGRNIRVFRAKRRGQVDHNENLNLLYASYKRNS